MLQSATLRFKHYFCFFISGESPEVKECQSKPKFRVSKFLRLVICYSIPAYNNRLGYILAIWAKIAWQFSLPMFTNRNLFYSVSEYRRYHGNTNKFRLLNNFMLNYSRVKTCENYFGSIFIKYKQIEFNLVNICTELKLETFLIWKRWTNIISSIRVRHCNWVH